MIQWTSVILAGGKGTRMKSPLPKVLHPVAGTPLILRVIESVKKAGCQENRVVVGYGKDLVEQVVKPAGGICLLQKEQHGPADAVKSANIDSMQGFVLIMNGDHPLVSSEDLKKLMQEFEKGSSALAVVTVKLKSPGSYGRVVRNYDEVEAIVEAKDASASTLKINEVNTGIYLTRAETLQELVPKIQNSNSKKEYYLTDLVELCRQKGDSVQALSAHPRVSFGVNSQVELAKATSYVFRKKAKALMDEGVMLIDPRSTYIEDSVEVESGAVIYPGAFLRGKTRIGAFSVIEPNCFISDSEIKESVQIRMGSHLEKATVHSKAVVGPYARLRPDSELEEEVQIGNFVELKKTKMKKGAKAAHLTYLGDAEVGEKTNIGCGVITCNYAADRKKYKTKIGANAFIGSDCQFIAPVEVGDEAVIGSGSTITKNVPSGALAVARGRQFVKENYQVKSSTESHTSKAPSPATQGSSQK